MESIQLESICARLISPDLSIRMKMEVFLSSLSLLKEHSFSLEGCFSEAECSVHKSSTLLLNRDKIKLWQLCGLLWFGPHPHSPQMWYNTFMSFDKGERHLSSKILYQVCSLPSPTTFLKAGWFDIQGDHKHVTSRKTQFNL